MDWKTMAPQSIAHYRLTGKIGEGGMGAVYRATDTKLARDVAIKVLPDAYSGDTDRLARFTREAQVLASLNHPNIATIFGIEERAIVMELVEGPTLADRIAQGPLPIDEAVRIARQIAEALKVAHEKGIVHRDLKPANVKITPDGAVKVLDFGLAKLSDAKEEPEPGLAATIVKGQSPTIAGMILGTAGYMSPEQAAGQSVDRRADIWAFGVVFWEMLCGAGLFQGETVIHMISDVMRAPIDFDRLPPSTPRPVRTLIRRCLERDVKNRLQDIGEARYALEQYLTTGEPEVPAVAIPRPAPVVRRWPWVAAIGVALMAGWVLHRPPPPFRGPKLTRATFDSGLTCDPAISPDGKLLAYASDRAGNGNLDIWVQAVNGGDPVQLTHDDFDDSEPSFSADGSQIVYRSERDGGGVYVIGALGGQSRLVAREGRTPRFSPDGSQIAYWIGKGGRSEQLSRQGGRIFVAPAGGGEPRRLASTVPVAASPIWSPDGRKLLFVGLSPSSDAMNRRLTWYITPVSEDRPALTNAEEVLAGLGNQMPTPSQWLPSNQIIFGERRTDGANLYRVAIDDATARVSGPPEQITFGGGVEDAPSVAASGLIAMADLTWNFDLWSLPIDGRTGEVTGDPIRLTDSLVAEGRPALSGDGRKLAYQTFQPQQNSIWVRDLASGRSTRILSFPNGSSTPFLNDDGSTLVYSRLNGKARTIFTIPTTGGLGQRVLEDTGYAESWTPSGKIVHQETSPRRVGVLDLKTHTSRRLLQAEKSAFYQTSFSPDEKSIAFIFMTSSRTTQVFIAPAGGAWPIPQSEWIAVTDGNQWDDKPRWSPGGNFLYMTSDRDGYRCLWGRRIDPATNRPVDDLVPVRHFHSSRRSMMNMSVNTLELAVARDRIAFAQGEVTGNVWLVKLP
ncbi:MAG: protein kinase [Bryobacteraceae bacterium]